MSVSVKLSNQSLWDSFHSRCTEMIVTKTGRKMFPKLEYLIEGLDPQSSYCLVLQILQVDSHRYKFSGGEWTACGRGEVRLSARNVQHHEGVQQGKAWMRGPVQFDHVKITNNPQDTNPAHVFLHSMHKYVPQLTVFEVPSAVSTTAPFLASGSPPREVTKVTMCCTEFIAVTAYQNEKMKELKIEHNPYAKGFRDGGDRKRPNSSDNECGPSPKRMSPVVNLVNPMTNSLGNLMNPVGNLANALGSMEKLPMVPLSPMANPLWCNFNPYYNYYHQLFTSAYRFQLPK